MSGAVESSDEDSRCCNQSLWQNVNYPVFVCNIYVAVLPVSCCTPCHWRDVEIVDQNMNGSRDLSCRVDVYWRWLTSVTYTRQHLPSTYCLLGVTTLPGRMLAESRVQFAYVTGIHYGRIAWRDTWLFLQCIKFTRVCVINNRNVPSHQLCHWDQQSQKWTIWIWTCDNDFIILGDVRTNAVVLCIWQQAYIRQACRPLSAL